MLNEGLKDVGNINMLNQVVDALGEGAKMGNLCPVSGRLAALLGGIIDPSKWEELRAIVDSGATVPVLHPKTGRAYPVQESAASRAGVGYEVADGGTLANLGEKLLAVLTQEGTLRGYTSQCADVSKSLQSVRALGKSGHAVCFSLGPDGNDHIIVNRHSGEVNRMDDDGINYIQKLRVIPPDQIAALQELIRNPDQLAALQEIIRDEHAPDFVRRGR